MEGISTREKLILSGMDEIRDYGIEGFSLRRTAARCGVSCAAPYKHFAGKQDMLLAMVDYVNERWRSELKSFTPSDSIVESAADFSMHYIKFLLANPHYKSVLMIKNIEPDSSGKARKVTLTVPAKRLVVRYLREKGLTRGEVRDKIFIARSLVFGAVFTIDADKSLEEERTETFRKAFVSIFS